MKGTYVPGSRRYAAGTVRANMVGDEIGYRVLAGLATITDPAERDRTRAALLEAFTRLRDGEDVETVLASIKGDA